MNTPKGTPKDWMHKMTMEKRIRRYREANPGLLEGKLDPIAVRDILEKKKKHDKRKIN